MPNFKHQFNNPYQHSQQNQQRQKPNPSMQGQQASQLPPQQGYPWSQTSAPFQNQPFQNQPFQSQQVFQGQLSSQQPYQQPFSQGSHWQSANPSFQGQQPLQGQQTSSQLGSQSPQQSSPWSQESAPFQSQSFQTFRTLQNQQAFQNQLDSQVPNQSPLQQSSQRLPILPSLQEQIFLQSNQPLLQQSQPWQQTSLSSQEQQLEQDTGEEKVKGKARGKRRFMVFHLTFQYKPDCFLDNALCNRLDLLDSPDHAPLAGQLYNLIRNSGVTYGFLVRNFYYINHDQDVNEQGEPVVPHMHVLVDLAGQYKDFKGLNVDEMSEISGLKPQQITFPKYSNQLDFFESTAAYLSHFTHELKTQYDPRAVHGYFDKSCGGQSYLDLFNDSIPLWTKVREFNYAKELSKPQYKERLLDLISKGAFGSDPKSMLISHPFWGDVYLYSRGKKEIDELCNSIKGSSTEHGSNL